VIDRDIFLICTGTGVAPFRSMAHHIKNHHVPHDNIYLIFGCRKTTDCLYGGELKALQSELPNFHYIPTFSREEPGDYKTGYVHTVYEEICKNEFIKVEDGNGTIRKPAYFYLCGWKNMIDEAKDRIIKLGYDKKSIHLELYG
jgi:CDP-4-dehydro-6-deoxyglucose reductase